MHITSLKAGEAVSETYGVSGKLVVDVGGKDVNGSLRAFFEAKGMKFVCVDMEAHSSVDIVVKPGAPLPFETGSVDIIVSTSCFEHDPCFWMTFREMARIVKPDGIVYVNAPTAGFYHGFPGDNWRFFSDAGQALAYWSGVQVATETVYPMKVVETFNILGTCWNDFVCVWKRTDVKETHITVQPDVMAFTGPLETAVRAKGFGTRKRC